MPDNIPYDDGLIPLTEEESPEEEVVTNVPLSE